MLGTALLATGMSSMALAAQNQISQQPACYGTCASGTQLSESWSLISYGAEDIQVFRVTVSSAFIGEPAVPTGTVAIKTDSTTVCTIVLSDGKGSCSPPPNALPPGTYSVRGYYSGDSTYSPSVSNAKSFTVSAVGSGD